MSKIPVDNKKIIDGVLAYPGYDTNVYYSRDDAGGFIVEGSFNGTEDIFDWVMTRTLDTRVIKSGVVKLAANKSNVKIYFDSAFPDSDYYAFFLSNFNTNLYCVEKNKNNFVIKSSFDVGSEISWFAVHKSYVTSSQINNKGALFAGTRILTVDELPTQYDGNSVEITTLAISGNSNANLTGWYAGEYIIKPDFATDGFQTLPNLNDYSLIISINKNINTFYLEKSTDRAKIGASYPIACKIDYLMVKNGIDWLSL